MVLVGHSFKVWHCLYVVVAAIVLLTTPSRAFTSLSRAIVKPCSSSSSSCSSSRIFSSAAGTTTELVNGLVKRVSQPGRGGPITLGDMATIKYSCYIPGEDKSPPFAKADRQKMVRKTDATTNGCDGCMYYKENNRLVFFGSLLCFAVLCFGIYTQQQ